MAAYFDHQGAPPPVRQLRTPAFRRCVHNANVIPRGPSTGFRRWKLRSVWAPPAPFVDYIAMTPLGYAMK